MVGNRQEKIQRIKMKPISPIKVVFKGGLADLQFLKVNSVFDNLVDYVCFEWSVYVDETESAGGGRVELKGLEQYTTWDASAAGAYKLVADSIGLELVENPNVWDAQ
jgi:hypothetical protein